jgi:hypothetical protein
MSLGAVLLKRGRGKEAREVYAASLRELQAELGDDHAWTSEVRDILAKLKGASALYAYIVAMLFAAIAVAWAYLPGGSNFL